MSNLRLIDGNSVGRAAHAATKLTAGSLQTQAIFNVVKASRDWVMDSAFRPLVLWDGRAEWRYELYPEYKGKRNDTPEKIADREAYNAQKPILIKMLGLLGIKQVMVGTEEADDLAGYFIRLQRARSPGAKIKLTTGDEDWAQLLGEGVEWQDHRKRDKILTLDNLFDKTGYRTPYAFLEGKALTGDKSDNIAGVGGIGDKKAPEFLAEFGSVREFWRRVDSGEFVPRYATHKRLASPEGRAAFGRNLRLMQLIKPRPFDQKDMVVYPSTFDREAFLDAATRLSFMSIVRDSRAFMAPFERNSGAK